MSVETVEMRSDHNYIGRPLAFTWQGKRFEVADVLIRYQTPHGYQFRVRTIDNNIFVLDFDSPADRWSINQL